MLIFTGLLTDRFHLPKMDLWTRRNLGAVTPDSAVLLHQPADPRLADQEMGHSKAWGSGIQEPGVADRPLPEPGALGRTVHT